MLMYWMDLNVLEGAAVSPYRNVSDPKNVVVLWCSVAATGKDAGEDSGRRWWR